MSGRPDLGRGSSGCDRPLARRRDHVRSGSPLLCDVWRWPSVGERCASRAEGVRVGQAQGRPGRGRARSPGPLVRGARPDQETAGAPGTGGRPRPQERDGTRAPGTRHLQRTVDEAGRSGEANGVGPGLSGPDPRVYRPPRPDGRQGRCPDETGRVVHREGADGASQGALPRRGSPRPIAGARLAAPGLQEARKPLDQARGGGRREGRVRPAEARQPALEVAAREAPRGFAEQPRSAAREGRAGTGGGHRSPCRADGLARLRHRRRAVTTHCRERAEPHRRSSRFECTGDVGGIQPIGSREAAGGRSP